MSMPNLGDRVRVWPFPGRRVQLDARPVAPDKGGRYLSDEGHEVVWSTFHVEQLRAGDLLLHSPEPPQAAEPAPLPLASSDSKPKKSK